MRGSRVAGFLADDEGIKTDVDAGTDVHSYTASVIGCSRQDAKAHTFKPLYGGVSVTDDQKRYYNAFKEKYNNVTKWHEFLQKHAVTKKYIQLPSGRQYAFPDCKRRENGSVSHMTNIKNYPVQGFATGDVVPVVLMEIEERLKGLQSCLVNTVHDSAVIDIHPDEKEYVIAMINTLNDDLNRIIEEAYGVEMNVPLLLEAKIGPNWLDTVDV